MPNSGIAHVLKTHRFRNRFRLGIENVLLVYVINGAKCYVDVILHLQSPHWPRKSEEKKH